MMGDNQRVRTSGECVMTVPSLVIRQRALTCQSRAEIVIIKVVNLDGEYVQWDIVRDVHRWDRA